MANGRLTYVGHATVLIEVGGARFLTDPLLHGGIAHMRRRVPLPQLEQLRDLDAVLISHAHADHLDIRSLRMLGHAGAVIAPRGCAGILRRAGMRDVVELMPGDRYTVAGVEVEAVRADHDGRRHPFGQDIPAVGFLLEGRRASTSPATPTCSTRWRRWRAASMWRCCRSGAGVRGCPRGT